MDFRRIQTLDEIKDLGVIFDKKKLTFKSHIESIICKTNCMYAVGYN